MTAMYNMPRKAYPNDLDKNMKKFYQN